MRGFYFILIFFFEFSSFSLQIENISYPAEVSQFKKFEIKFNIDRIYANPFDPEEVNAGAEFTSPSGRKFFVPAFFTQDFDVYLDEGIEKFRAITSPYWAIRFSPSETGTYAFRIEVSDTSGEAFSQQLYFESIPSKNRGFVRVNSRNPRYFTFDNGDPYIPIGFNICWATDNRGSFYYDYFLNRLRDAGGNWVRIWMTHYYQGLTIEWGEYHPSGYYHGLGRYSLEVAERIDRIIETAEELGIYIQLVLQHHSAFETLQWSSWDENPYNVKNGGMLKSSIEFFSNPEANRLFDQRLRYIISRWGYSTSIFAWELWNEVDGITGYYENRDLIKKWHEDKVQKIRNLDVHRHLITTSFTLPYFLERTQFWDMEGLDYTQYHAYFTPLRISYQMAESARALSIFNKPTFAGEFSIDWLGANLKYDPEGIHIHNGLWASVLSGNAGTGMSWWWDNYVEGGNLWFHLKGISEFLKNEDLSKYEEVWTEGVEAGPSAHVEIMGLRSASSAMLWVHDKLSDWNHPSLPSEKRDIRVKINGLIPGKYDVEFWDTFEGKITRSRIIELKGEDAIIEIIPFRRDIAVKLRYAGTSEEGCGCSSGKEKSSGIFTFFIFFLMAYAGKMFMKLKRELKNYMLKSI